MPKKKGINPIIFTPEYRLDMIPVALNKHEIMFSQREAARLVGGMAKLLRLIEQGKVRVEKKTPSAPNGKWQCNGGDVIKNIRI